MHRKHGIDRGTEGSGAWGWYPGGVWGAPSSAKVTTYLQLNCTAPDFPYLDRRLPSGTGHRPIQRQSATRRPHSRLWTVGIAWCTLLTVFNLEVALLLRHYGWLIDWYPSISPCKTCGIVIVVMWQGLHGFQPCADPSHLVKYSAVQTILRLGLALFKGRL